jgi:hypothetical protein
VPVCGVGEKESVTLKVCVTPLLVAVGVPLIVAVDPAGVKINGEGSGGLTVQSVYGGVPPVAVRVALYAVPTTPLGSEGGFEIDGCGRALIEIVRVACTTCGVGDVESWTTKIGETLCMVVGVPLIAPSVLRLRPVGRAGEPAARLQV